MAMQLLRGVFYWIICGKSAWIFYTFPLRADIHHFSSKFIVWISAFSNRHYTVAVVTLVAILALVIQPLCGSVFILKNTWWGPDR